MKNSKGETLPQPYLDLARMRGEQRPSDGSIFGFIWNNTPECYDFWSCVNRGETPVIFEFSLAELDEWRKAKSAHISISDFDPKINEKPYAQPAEAEPATDWKAKYEEMKAERDYYRHEYELKCIELDDIDNKPTPTRNWVAECAMAAMQALVSREIPLKAAEYAFDYAEAWAAEGRKRGHIN